MKITKLFAAMLAVVLTFSVLTLCVLADEADVPADADTPAVETVNAEEDGDLSVIGGADGPTAITVATADGLGARMLRHLGYMGAGMACIIAVMGALILVTVILNKVTAPKDK